MTAAGPGVFRLAGRVILGEDREVSEAWVLGGKVTFERPRHSGPVTTLQGFVLPGLVDVHCHVGLTVGGAAEPDLAEKQAAADRDSGVLLIRDAGSASDTSWINGRDELPRIIRAGQFLARPKRYIRGYARELESVDELPAAAEEEARSSTANAPGATGDPRTSGWVKVIADWIDRDGGAAADLAPLWPRETLKLAVDRAHAAGARVTAHTFATESIDDLLDAGVDCLEHGTGMTATQINRAAASGIPVVPTLLQVGEFASIAAQGEQKYPVFSARMRGMYERRYAQARAFHEAGVPLLVGTDAGGSIGHGALPEEAAELVVAGIPPAVVVAAASWRAREFLGAPGIEEGASADLVVYPDDPRVDITALARPSVILLRGIVANLPPLGRG